MVTGFLVVMAIVTINGDTPMPLIPLSSVMHQVPDAANDQKKQFIGVNDHQPLSTTAQVNGTWQSKFGTFKIWAIAKQKLKVEFSGFYPYKLADGTPSANVGMGGGIALLDGRKATFRPEGADDECLITMEFVRREMVVNQKGICGFGHNVTAAGIYRKVNADQPKFEGY